MSSLVLAEPQVKPQAANSADESWYEIIDGKRVELPPMSFYASYLASQLVFRLNEYAQARGAGVAVGEVLFHLALPVDRNRRPDAAFVSYERWPRDRDMPQDQNVWDVVPDVAVEVISPNEYVEDLLEKVEEYLQSGVRLVWVVYPRRRIIQVFESLHQIRGLTHADELDGGGVLPGFRLPLSSFFRGSLG